MKTKKVNYNFFSLSALILLFLFDPEVYGQEDRIILEQALEDLELLYSGELSDDELETRIELVQELFEDKVNINSENVTVLADHGLISDYQLNKLREYRFMFGDLLSLNELQLIDGWDTKTSRRVMPFVSLADSPPQQRKVSAGKFPVRHEIILSAGRILELAEGYKPDHADSTNRAHYSGSPWKCGLRYDLKAGKWFIAGIRAEKDPGEMILPYHTEYPARMNYPDHLSAYVVLAFQRFIRKVCLGDYQISFGRGISLSTSRGFSSWKDPFGQSTPHNLIRKNSSMAEWGYFRGASMHIALGNFSVYPFFSDRKLDPSGYREEDSVRYFSSFNESGYHRTQAEAGRRGLVDERTYGGMVVFQNRRFKAGILSCLTRLSISRQPADRTYAKYSISGLRNHTSGAFLELVYRKSAMYCEISLSDNRKVAIIAGWQAILSPSSRISLDIRHFPVKFQPGFHSGGTGPSGNQSNESGFRAGLEISLPGKWNVTLASDYARLPWFSYGMDFSSHRYALHIRAVKSKHEHKMLLSYTYRQSDESVSREFSYCPVQDTYASHQADIQLVVNNGEWFRYKCRISGILTRDVTEGWDAGTLWQQEISYRFARPGLRLSLGGVLFHTDNYASRLYAYEASILYSSGSQSYYGRGVRTYGLIQYVAGRYLDLWIKAAMTIYEDTHSIGSGWDAIDGDRRSYIGVQLRIRL
jgi:hypothetical protein